MRRTGTVQKARNRCLLRLSVESKYHQSTILMLLASVLYTKRVLEVERQKMLSAPEEYRQPISLKLQWRPPDKATITVVVLTFGANRCFPTRGYRWKRVENYQLLANGENLCLRCVSAL